MLKYLALIVFILLLLACRKDPVIPFIDIPNPCGNNKKVCTFPTVITDGADSLSVYVFISQLQKVKMTLFDRYGNVMADLLDSCLIAGGHQFKFDAAMLPIGTNVCLIEVKGDSTYVEKVMRL